jgi:peptidoglycan/LPS O-acetylase OafA/YrhL
VVGAWSHRDPGIVAGVTGSAVLYVLTLAITGTVAAVSYTLVELPFLRHKESNRIR